MRLASSLSIVFLASLSAQSVMAPRFEVDLTWPKPLPNHWILGAAIGVSADAKDHIWIVHRPGSLEPGEMHATTNPRTAHCCAPAPPILEFDQQGNLLRHWGGPGAGYDWPESNHGITIDYKGNVWIGGNFRPQPLPEGFQSFHDDMVLKFTQDGKFPAADREAPARAREQQRSWKICVCRRRRLWIPKTNELYIADGYGNHRVIVFDADTGAYKRHWGAYGNRPELMRIPARTSLGIRTRSSFAIRCIVRSFQTTACSMCAIASTTAFRFSSPMEPS